MFPRHIIKNLSSRVVFFTFNIATLEFISFGSYFLKYIIASKKFGNEANNYGNKFVKLFAKFGHYIR